jgi:RimJ/RimL family protein N-acetyltransferase
MTIATAHLRLLPFAPTELLALCDGVVQFETLTGLHAADGLRGFLVSGEVSPAWMERLRAATEYDPWTHGFAVVEGDSDTVVGVASFKGPPDGDGVVEIAYGVVPGSEGRGYATEAAAALVDFAQRDARVRVVRAHTLPERNASTRVLTKCGFELRGEVIDPEDGLVWRWERTPTPQRAAT